MIRFRMEWQDAPGVRDTVLARTWCRLVIRSGWAFGDGSGSWPLTELARRGLWFGVSAMPVDRGELVVPAERIVSVSRSLRLAGSRQNATRPGMGAAPQLAGRSGRKRAARSHAAQGRAKSCRAVDAGRYILDAPISPFHRRGRNPSGGGGRRAGIGGSSPSRRGQALWNGRTGSQGFPQGLGGHLGDHGRGAQALRMVGSPRHRPFRPGRTYRRSGGGPP